MAQSVFLLGNRSMPALGEAEGLYRKALELDPQNADALIGVGAVLASRMFNFRYVLGWNQDQIRETSEQAIAFLDRGLHLRADSAIVHSYKGLVFGAGLRWREAMQEYGIAHSLDSNFIPIYNNTANAWIALGEPEKALRRSSETMRRTPIEPHLGSANLAL